MRVNYLKPITIKEFAKYAGAYTGTPLASERALVKKVLDATGGLTRSGNVEFTYTDAVCALVPFSKEMGAEIKLNGDILKKGAVVLEAMLNSALSHGQSESMKGGRSPLARRGLYVSAVESVTDWMEFSVSLRFVPERVGNHRFKIRQLGVVIHTDFTFTLTPAPNVRFFNKKTGLINRKLLPWLKSLYMVMEQIFNPKPGIQLYAHNLVVAWADVATHGNAERLEFSCVHEGYRVGRAETDFNIKDQSDPVVMRLMSSGDFYEEFRYSDFYEEKLLDTIARLSDSLRSLSRE